MSDSKQVMPRRSRWKTGCLWILSLIAIIYAGNAARLLIPNAINRAKWERQGITHYEIDIHSGSFAAHQGDHRIEVNDQQVVQVETIRGCTDCSLSAFDDLTVEAMFSRVTACVLWFPLYSCKYQYDTQYGYPEVFQEGCPLIPAFDVCTDYFEVQAVHALD